MNFASDEKLSLYKDRVSCSDSEAQENEIDFTLLIEHETRERVP